MQHISRPSRFLFIHSTVITIKAAEYVVFVEYVVLVETVEAPVEQLYESWTSRGGSTEYLPEVKDILTDTRLKIF